MLMLSLWTFSSPASLSVPLPSVVRFYPSSTTDEVSTCSSISRNSVTISMRGLIGGGFKIVAILICGGNSPTILNGLVSIGGMWLMASG